METITTNKITKATFKAFINKNRDNLFVLHKSSFDSMDDCIHGIKGIPCKVEFTNEHTEHSLYVKGLWLVGHGRDYFKAYEDEIFRGIEVSNSCGFSIVAVIK